MELLREVKAEVTIEAIDLPEQLERYGGSNSSDIDLDDVSLSNTSSVEPDASVVGRSFLLIIF